MAQKPAPPQSIIEGFILRARRVMAHSLLHEQAELMEKLQTGGFTLKKVTDGEPGGPTHHLKIEYPSEEAMESLASRVRPIILGSEPIYYRRVLNALEELVGTDQLNEHIDLPWWHGYWDHAVDGNLEAQAYWVSTVSGTITDRKLMYAWLYGDVVHANAKKSPAIQKLDINDRYHAAAPGIARICERVIYTSMMLGELIGKGVLTVAPEVLTDDVVVTSNAKDLPVHAFCAPLGVPIPEGIITQGPAALEGTEWISPHEDPELVAYLSKATKDGVADE